MVPVGDERVDVDESADVIIVALPQHLLVYAPELTGFVEIVGPAGIAPPDVQRKLDDAGCFLDRRIVDIVGNGHGSCLMSRHWRGSRAKPRRPSPAFERPAEWLGRSDVGGSGGGLGDLARKPGTLVARECLRPRDHRRKRVGHRLGAIGIKEAANDLGEQPEPVSEDLCALSGCEDEVVAVPTT